MGERRRDPQWGKGVPLRMSGEGGTSPVRTARTKGEDAPAKGMAEVGATSRGRWSIALAAFVGSAAGGFVAPSMDSLGVSTEGATPLLAGGAAIFTASLLGAVLGAVAGALVAFVVVRAGRPRTGAITGSVFGILAGVLAGYFSEALAEAWVNAFSGNPLGAALIGGLLAGLLGGGTGAVIAHVSVRSVPSFGRPRTFAALLGGLFGLLSGIGGGGIGATLAQSASFCPNGYYANPSPLPYGGCVPGLLPGALVLGMWGGAVAGVLSGVAVFTFLSFERRPSLPVHATPPS